METVIFSVDSIESVKQSMHAAFSGIAQPPRISFESFELLWKVLAPNRTELVKAMAGAGPMSLREAARRVNRDVSAVHADVHLLLRHGVLDRLDDGRICFPFDAIHIEFDVLTAA